MILPLHFLCKSSLFSMQTMAKGHYPFINTTVPITANGDGQKMVFENKKILINDNHHHSSHNFLKKICKIKIHSLSLNHLEQKLNDTLNETKNNSSDPSRRVSTPIINYTSILESHIDSEVILSEKSKPKGILKNSNSNNIRYTHSTNSLFSKSNSKTSQTINSEEKNINLVSLDSNSDNLNSFKTIKHVTFSEKVSKKRYIPRKLIFGETTLKHRQQIKLKKEQRKDSLNSMKLQESDFCESSEYESSDNEDQIISPIKY